MPAQYSKDQGQQWTQPTVIAEITQASDHPLRTQWRAIEQNPYKNRKKSTPSRLRKHLGKIPFD